MEKNKSFFQKVLDGIANRIGEMIVLFIVSLLFFAWGLFKKLDKIENKLQAIDSVYVSKFTFGVWMEQMNGRIDSKSRDIEDIKRANERLEKALKEIQDLHPRQRGFTSKLNNKYFELTYKAVFIHPKGKYTNDQDR